MKQLASPDEASKSRGGAAFVNGEFCEIERASISLLDFAFLRSDACQDTISVWRGSFFCLDDHMRRFHRSCAMLHLACPYDEEALTPLLSELVRRSRLRDAYVQMIMMRGQPAPGSRDIRTCRNHFAAFVVPYVRITPDDGSGPLNVIISDRPRIPNSSVPSAIKNYHWIDFELGLFEAYGRGGNTVVLSDGAGHVTEGPGYNVFCVTRGRIATPDNNVLDGITRSVIGTLAGELGIEMTLRPITADEVRSADEVFISSTAGGVMPVNSVDGMQLPGATPGSVCDRLSKHYWARRGEGWRGLPVDYTLPGAVGLAVSKSFASKGEI